MRGYKAFDKNLQCHGFQYEIGKTFEYDGEIKICEKGFHFCDKVLYCFNYYPTDLSETRIAEVEATGEILCEKENETESHKFCTNKIKIIRELSTKEILTKMNLGRLNSGYGNKGDMNEGNCNIGDDNIGHYNTGTLNIGSYNTGRDNVGESNKGPYNIGYNNEGSFNIGRDNNGFRNRGILNYGNANVGCYNNGVSNLGFLNKGDYCLGVLCTEPQTIKLFNKESNWTYEQLICSKIIDKIENLLKGLVPSDEKVIVAKEISELPNFDNEIFKDITGIDIEEILKNTRRVL